ncbi:MAG: Flp pilus assembly protein CpaB [Armatimonadetes bacterium]|nr:Flp pilus assembly protein CpaB [Armatimonadota bacterium]
MRLTRRQALAISMACGVLAAVLAYVYLKRPGPASTKSQPQPQETQVLVAAVDLTTGTRLNPALVSVKTLPEDKVPRQAIKADKEWTAKIEGLVAVAPVKAGEILTDSLVRRPSSDLGLAFMVPDGMRAVTVALDEVSGISFLAKPGDRVDVLATFDLPDDTVVTRTVLQDVEVLAVGTEIVPEPEPSATSEEGKARPKSKRQQQTTATLAVTPDEAQKLVLADSKGKIRLALRRAGDSTLAAAPAVTLTDLTGYVPPKLEEEETSQQKEQQQMYPPWYQPPQPGGGGGKTAAKPQNAVEVVRGNEREVIVP